MASGTDAVYTMYGETGYLSTIPAFSIAASSAAWIVEQLAALHDAGMLYTVA
jgi:hypothetical protein